MTSRIYYTKPSITQLEVSYATDATANGWGEHCYDYINRFEELFRKHLNVKHAIATSSCTGALHMGLSALGIQPGDEIILADSNWIASVAPITYLGARPIFVDILPDSWCLDPTRVREAITPRTKAIIAVHLYGNLCAMNELMAIGTQHDIPVIEDAAEAIGSIYNGKRAGSIGKFGTFSFHGTKTATTGEGGMFVTNDTELYERVLTLSNHGRSRHQTKQFWPDIVGFKYKISNIQAAIGCAQMERIEELILRKRDIFNLYKKNIVTQEFVKMNPESEGTEIGAWMPTVVFHPNSGVTRDSIRKSMLSNNIDARAFFYPLSSLPMFDPNPNNTHAYDIPDRAINLPSYHDMTNDDIQRVCEIVNAQLARVTTQ
jgi:perosamine synthetase